jgi:hypothetical protein
LYGQVIGRQIRYARNGTEYEGTNLYAKMHLDYHTFLFIIDAMGLLGLLYNKIGNYSRKTESGYRSRISFTDKGRTLFNAIKSDNRFEDITERDLLVLTDIKTKTITKGKNAGKVKEYVEPISYKDTKNTRDKKKFIKQINGIYKKHKLTVDADNITLK